MRGGAGPVRPAAQGRPRGRWQERHFRGAGRGHCAGKDRGGRAEHCGVAGQADDRCFVALRHARACGHARPRIRRQHGPRIYRRKLRPPGRLHLSQRRDHGGGRGQFRLAQFRRIPRPDHQSLQDTRVRDAEYRRQRDGRAAGCRAEHQGHGTGAYRRSGEAPQATSWWESRWRTMPVRNGLPWIAEWRPANWRESR